MFATNRAAEILEAEGIHGRAAAGSAAARV
jgi:hypothetical protein